MPRPDLLSISSLSMFQRCPEQWRRRYMEHERIPPGVALIRGKSVDAGANHTLKGYRDSELKALPPVQEALEVSRDQAAMEFDHGEVWLTDEEREKGLKKVRDATIDETVRLTGGHHSAVAPITKPKIIQAHIKGRIANVKFQGYLDLVEQDGCIDDLKTSGKRPIPDAARQSQQLVAYAAMYGLVDTGKAGLPDRSPKQRLDYLVPYKTMTKGADGIVPDEDGSGCVAFYRQEISIDDEDVQRFKLKLKAIDRAIDSACTTGYFPPTDPSNWWCSKNWCGYYETCPYVRGGKKITV